MAAILSDGVLHAEMAGDWLALVSFSLGLIGAPTKSGTRGAIE